MFQLIEQITNIIYQKLDLSTMLGFSVSNLNTSSIWIFIVYIKAVQLADCELHAAYKRFICSLQAPTQLPLPLPLQL